jgi:hypothetical protein
VTTYKATIGGTAYGEHRKAAVGWTEGPTSAASGLFLRRNTRPEKVKVAREGSTDPSSYLALPCTVLRYLVRPSARLSAAFC